MISDERKYSCDICGKHFKRPTDREYHVNTIHKNIFKHYCPHCGHGVHRLHYLKNHQCNRIHRREGQLPRMEKGHKLKSPSTRRASASVPRPEFTIASHLKEEDGDAEARASGTVVVQPYASNEVTLVVTEDGQVRTQEEVISVGKETVVMDTHTASSDDTNSVEDSQSEVANASSVIDSEALANILPENTSGGEQKWIIQQSEDGQQILVIQAGLEDTVGDGTATEILVQAGEDSGAQEVAQICEAAAILTQNLAGGSSYTTQHVTTAD